MNWEYQHIMETCQRMKAGQSVRVERHIFEGAFPCHPLLGAYNNPVDAFLSGMIGSAWGKWRVNIDFETGDYIISKHNESHKRYYVDPDRRHLFKQEADGTWKLK
jgi:hypothetical protein